MKNFAHLTLLLVALSQLPVAASQTKLVLLPGMEVTEYPRHASQSDLNQVYLAPEKLGEPIGKMKIAKSLHPWEWESERNAIAKGVLVIDADGDYAFSTDSFYDRNLLMIDGKVVCGFRDGGSRIVTIPLKKGNVEIVSVGYVDGRGSAKVRWRPPGQRELSEIPAKQLKHLGLPKIKSRKPGAGHEAALQAKSLTVVAKDFVIDVYKNGKKIPEAKREFLLDRFGASAERIHVDVRDGDWLVFHVAHNRLRHKGTKYFAVAGAREDNPFSIVSDPESEQWSVCDDPGKVKAFIRERGAGTKSRALPIEKPWEEGMKFIRQFAGDEFFGKPLWGSAPSTWIKYVAPGSGGIPAIESPARMVEIQVDNQEEDPAIVVEITPGVIVLDELPRIMEPKRWPVQILSATYGTGGKDADVTERIKQLVEVERKFYAANPGHLKVDPNPYWNKQLHVVFMKDGVRREQWRNENEHVLPESFYGPQDAAELSDWLIDTRWKGPRGEVQFHPNGVLAGPGTRPAAYWESLDKNHLRVTWPDDQKADYVFDYFWRSFGRKNDGKDAYQLVK